MEPKKPSEGQPETAPQLPEGNPAIVEATSKKTRDDTAALLQLGALQPDEDGNLVIPPELQRALVAEYDYHKPGSPNDGRMPPVNYQQFFAMVIAQKLGAKKHDTMY